MNFLQKKLAEFSDHLPPAVFRLMSAIFSHASQAVDDEARWSAPKADVLKELEKSESNQPSGDVVRQRLQTFKSLMEQSPGWISEDIPLIAVRSTKSNFEITTNLQFINALERQNAKSAITKSGHDDYKSHLGSIEPVEPRFALPVHSVFVSHHWEEDERDDILDEFVAKLGKSLRKLPSKWSGKFQVKLIYDRAGAFHGRDGFEKQSDELCEQSSFGVYMVSNGWCQSGPCQKEATHFASRTSVGKSYLAIQFVNARDELDDKWASCPNYPSFRTEWQACQNLIELWEKPNSIKEKFVAAIRDEICEFLDENGGDALPPKTKRPSGKLQKMGSLRERKVKLDTPAEKQVEALMLEENGGDTKDGADDGVSAVQTLYDWAIDGEAKHRTIILLGGFGMGKTTTVQMLHERLYQDVSKAENTPVPIYLDFRRLIPQTEHGKPLKISRDEMIATALHPDVVSQVGQQGISDLIRNENCLLIFDGLDEVGNRVGREHASQLYRQFLELIPSDVQAAEAESGEADWTRCKTRLVVTCRTHFFRSVRELNSVLCGAHRRTSSERSFDGQQTIPCTRVYHMAPLTLEQIEELFTKYLGSELGTETMKLIRGIHDLPGLAQRPIMARFISEVAGELVKIYEAGQPINIATIYDELFQLGLERDAEKRPLLKPNDREEMLVSLASHLHRNGLGPQSADDLEKWFDGFARGHDGICMILASGQVNCRNLLHTELENASFLIRDEGDKFRFAHTSYYEYFLALAIVQCRSAVAFSNLMQRTASTETYEFVYAIVEKEDLGQRLNEIWKHVLCSQEIELGARVSAFQLIATAKDWDLPQGANLSNFKMKNFRFGEGMTLRNVDFTKAQLNGMDARNTTFSDCNFWDANIANGTFENCEFANCRGVPKGLASARGVDTNLPKEWNRLVADRGNYWRKIEDPGTRQLILKNIVSSVAFSPDGQQILTGSSDGTARVWDVKWGAEILKLEGHGSEVLSVAFSPDGQQILTGSDDETARVWDAKSGAEILMLEGHGSTVTSVAFSPDGQQILTGSFDETARVWDAKSGAETLKLEGHEDWVKSVAFSPDGQQILTGSDDETARLWDAKSGVEILKLEGHGSEVLSVAFSPDGQQILTGSDDETARLWDAKSGAEILKLEGHADWVQSVAFSPDGQQMLTGSFDGTARLWDVKWGAEILKLEGHGSEVLSVAFSPDGQQILTGSDDWTARVWDARSGAEILKLKGHGSRVQSVAFSPDGQQILTGSSDETARVWDAKSGAEILKLEGHEDWVKSVAFSPDGQQILTGSDDGTARVWDAKSGAETLKLEGHGSRVQSVAFSPDGQQILTGSFDETARVWDAKSGAEILKLEGHGSSVQSVAFNPDGQQILTGSYDGTARVWDAKSGAEILKLEGHGSRVQSVAFSPDGQQILTGSSDRTARVWDARSGAEILKLEGHGRPVISAAFSPDGQHILTGSFDGTARVWDAKSGAEFLNLEGHRDWVQSVAFSPDGQHILTGPDDGTARLWDAKSGAEIFACVGLPESWAVLSPDRSIKQTGPNFWRYAA